MSHTQEAENIKGTQTINIYTIRNYFTYMYSVSYEDKKVISHVPISTILLIFSCMHGFLLKHVFIY